ncbi:hypothetical protein L195_g050040, partial [Trifolium pratense]
MSFSDFIALSHGPVFRQQKLALAMAIGFMERLLQLARYKYVMTVDMSHRLGWIDDSIVKRVS